jgi:hypothetical protein
MPVYYNKGLSEKNLYTQGHAAIKLRLSKSRAEASLADFYTRDNILPKAVSPLVQ